MWCNALCGADGVNCDVVLCSILKMAVWYSVGADVWFGICIEVWYCVGYVGVM